MAYIARDVTHGPFALFRIRDTGVGMDEATRGRIFEPFFTTKEEGKGTGLGLSMVYGIVKQNGGLITVDSAPGSGATFAVYLPLVAAEAEEPRSAAAPRAQGPPPGAGETIPLVEDEREVRTAVLEVLRRHGYRVMPASDAAEALAIGAGWSEPIPLLLTDVKLPGIGGRELAGILRRSRPAMRVLFMSGYNDDALLQDEISESRASFVAKPFSPDALMRKVGEILGGRPRSSAP